MHKRRWTLLQFELTYAVKSTYGFGNLNDQPCIYKSLSGFDFTFAIMLFVRSLQTDAAQSSSGMERC